MRSSRPCKIWHSPENWSLAIVLLSDYNPRCVPMESIHLEHLGSVPSGGAIGHQNAGQHPRRLSCFVLAVFQRDQ